MNRIRYSTSSGANFSLTKRYDIMSWRSFMCRPKVDDWAPLSKFFHADEALSKISSELDSFDNRRQADRCSHLLSQLRQHQDKVLQTIEEMLEVVFQSVQRPPRDYRVKFPEDIMHDGFAGQVWFGAECLAAGQNIAEHEYESETIRPLAVRFVQHMDWMRDELRNQALKNPTLYPDKIRQALQQFDELYADFELSYVSSMVPVKSTAEYNLQLDVTVMFSEALIRARDFGYITQDQIDDFDPSCMITLPRLAIICGLLIYPAGPLNLNRRPDRLPDMFRPFRKLLSRIRDLLETLSVNEVYRLERSISNIDGDQCSVSEKAVTIQQEESEDQDDKSGSSPQAVSTLLNAEEVKKTDGEDASGLTDYFGYRLNANQLGLRAQYPSTDDLLHRLFVCISGVADQLQSNYPADLRSVLKHIFVEPEVESESDDITEETGIPTEPGADAEIGVDPLRPGDENRETTANESDDSNQLNSLAPPWVPDDEVSSCTSCQSPFTLVRRRHHCRNCGHIFCHRCSMNSISLPEYGYDKAVRVCNSCFFFKVNPFTPNATNNNEAAVTVRSS